MGITQSVGTDHNLYWNLGDNLGNKFEDFIFNVLLQEFPSGEHPNINIEHTPRVNDHGKDIVIKFTSNTLNLFDVILNKGEKDEAIVYVECKSSNSKQALRREKIIPSITRGRTSEIDYYILLTNSKIQPSDYYEAECLLKEKDIQFVLIDQYLLANFLIKRKYEFFSEIPLYDGADTYFIQYQVEDVLVDQKYDIYFNFRNYSSTPQLYTISLLTNVNWRTEDNNFSFTVDANCAHSKKVSLSCDLENEYKTLIFKVETDGTESFVDINGINMEECYTPPLTGKYHNKILFCLYKDICSQKTNSLFCLWGEAGIGKTRIVSELENKLKSGHIDVYNCILSRNNSTTVKKISEFLFDKNYITKDVQKKYATNLYHTVSNCKNICKRALIFIDDFHNSGDELINQIKQLESFIGPVIIILCGRTDFSAGDTVYYKFVQWSYEKLKRKKSVWNVKPLCPKETYNLVRSMIKNIPEEALNTICRLSDNNPLYIVQFIEYLLDKKIAYVINRNSVGIIDPSKFQAHDFLPTGISDIYKKRLVHLNEMSGVYLQFLFILSVYGGEIPIGIVKKYLDSDDTIVPLLFNRKFVSKTKENIVFYHESLKIYIQNVLKQNNSYKKNISDYILSLPEVARNILPKYTCGRLYLWNQNQKEAIAIFRPIMDKILTIENISNIDIDVLLYEYFDDILQLCGQKDQYRTLAEKTIEGKIYITLHHFVPLKAAIECDKSISYVQKSKIFKDNNQLINSLKIQKAHALLNSGMNLEGELTLKEVQSQWLVSNEQFEAKAIFDMFDRLCAVYVKFNCYDVACDYSKLSLKMAEKVSDVSLSIIAYRTRAKLFYLNNLKKCQKSLDMVDELLKIAPSTRIQLNNNIYSAIVDLTYHEKEDYTDIINRLEQLRQQACDQNMNRAEIQSGMALAAAYLKRGYSKDIVTAKQIAKKAIDCSISYGIPSYLWQLYNLIGIIDTKLKKSTNIIKQSFENVYEILEKQDLLFIGRSDLCYSNLLAISNVAFFFQKYMFQKTFCERISKITYCTSAYVEDDTLGTSNNRHLTEDDLVQFFKKARNKELIFSSSNLSTLLRDDETGYFIALT